MRFFLFIVRLVKESEKDDLFTMAGYLTYKLLMAFFPFLLFLMSLMAFLNLDGSYWMRTLTSIMPGEAGVMVSTFFEEVISKRNAGVLSFSLLISLYNASSGFGVVIRCVNQTYGFKNCRNFLLNQLISISLCLMFMLSLAAMLVLMIFNDRIFSFLHKFLPIDANIGLLISAAGFIIAISVLIITLMLVYKFANCAHVSLKHVMPGALATVASWIITSKLFSVYVNNFSNYANAYGSIAGVFILIMWLNIVSTTLLVGSELNSMLDSSATPPEQKSHASDRRQRKWIWKIFQSK
jgi:membrane protein